MRPVGPTFTYVELDDRREVWTLLGLLTPARRVEWLRWCCKEASRGCHHEIRVTESDGSVGGVWYDAVTIFGQGRLTVAGAGIKLVDMLKRRS
jgi:hypothetical protein